MPKIELIDTTPQLHELCSRIEESDLVALDTEFVRESTYFAELCLIQLATDKLLVCLDCCADLDLSAFFEVLFDPQRRLLAHSGRQDIELLQQTAGNLPARLLDTQIAAGLLGHPPQIGLRELLMARLDIEIEKSMARTDWRRRPLGERELEYAATDVLHLAALWRSLAEELDAKGRTDWFEEDCARALTVEIDPGLITLYTRARGTGRLRGRHMTAALALLEWRESVARSSNRPRRWILKDEIVVELANQMPADAAALGRITALAPKTRSRHGDAMLETIARSDSARMRELAKQCLPGPRPDERALKSLQAKVQAAARELDIQSEVLATRRDLVAIVNGDPPEHCRSGWRAAILAQAD